VTDETPTTDEPTPGPDASAAAEEAAAPPPATPEPAVTTPEPETPQPVSAEPAAAASPTAEPPTAEAVTPPTAVAAPSEAATEPVAAPVATAAAAKSERRGGIFLPTWLAALIAVLFIGGVGFAIGYVSADSDDSSPSVAANTVPNRQGPFGNQLPNGGTVPGGSGSANGNGSGSNNGNGNGETNAQTAFLGVSVQDAASNGGAEITAVRAGSPAATAGLKQGDVVTKVGDTAVTNAEDLMNAIRSHKPGDDVTITYTRDGNSATATVHLGNRSDIARSSLPS
jgi:membrane-associated protease RseP (regulator of RpoE activity)